MQLGQGERLRVDTGCLVAFDPRVDYDIEFAAGIKTALFGGEGLFFATMTGPGRVWVQTLPFSRLADRIISASHAGREETKRDFGGDWRSDRRRFLAFTTEDAEDAEGQS